MTDRHELINIKMWQELRHLGYYDFQIREMLREWVGKERIGSLTPEEAARVAECFQRQIDFARRCYTVTGDSPR